MIKSSADEVAGIRPTLADLAVLMRDAFERVRSSGRTDWNVMTVPVLKNRLLHMTGRQFSEISYGAHSMSELIGQFPELLEIDTSVKPPKVRLREGGGQPAEAFPARYQIRRDLWNAVVDFDRGEPYLWTGTVALPESECGEAERLSELPTLTREAETAWRADFAASVADGLDDNDRDKVNVWLERQLSTRALPTDVQGTWNDHLRARVLDRLRQWFHDHDIDEPADLLVAASKPADRRDGPGLDELRAFVIRCVQNMNFEELSELRLPPQALLRTERRPHPWRGDAAK
ncbi:OST-HTH/LOTUS domain-containing protein [Rugosimonospora africana]|uniref:Uncharacterized protein n=1 Tax=Rugosimonospora africana TaxID=556532 RepID=A0A8J3QY65_9ACTN|nr:OST-HTH/LOTUS domain-containing protein [Rugosimonospora africana]GIH16836.1 hypothetical protein Raf01_50080 [Rugosimonospora africana]